MLMLMVSVVGWVLGVLLARRATRNHQAEQVLESDDVRGFRGPRGYRGPMDHPVHQAPRPIPNGQHRERRNEMWE